MAGVTLTAGWLRRPSMLLRAATLGLCAAVATMVVLPLSTRGATFTVINTNDSGSGSLREAITNANSMTSTLDTIDFFLGAGPGPYMIGLNSPLPNITDPVFINGYSQTGAVPNSLGPGAGTNAVIPIELVALNLMGSAPLRFVTGSGGSTVQGLAIGNFSGVAAIQLDDGSSIGNFIRGNFLGTDGTGLIARPNGDNVTISSGSNNNFIGGTSDFERNLIVNAEFFGVSIQNGSSGNLVANNLIGVNKAGTGAMGNTRRGVSVGGNGNFIGAPVPSALNIIGGNGEDAITIELGATNNMVQNNRIGTNAAGTGGIPNLVNGIAIISPASNNLIGGSTSNTLNIIGTSGNDAITIDNGSSGNTVMGNSIGVGVGGVPLPNLGNGITINDGSNNHIGGPGLGEGTPSPTASPTGCKYSPAVGTTFSAT